MNSKQITYNLNFAPLVYIERIGESIALTKKKEQCARDVIAGKYGTVDSTPSRRELVAKAGLDYEEIQGMVNKMLAKPSTYASPGINGATVMSAAEIEKILLSMSFTLSVNDITGTFALTMFPETKSGDSVFDRIKVMDIVKIYEPTTRANNCAPRIAFVGIVRSKKFVTQSDGSGGTRRVSISGISAAGLVSQFKVNLDVTAMAITKQMREQSNLAKELTVNLGGEPDKPVKDVVQAIWSYFLDVSQQNGTPDIAKYIEYTMGSAAEMFDIDDSTFHYPLGCVFSGNQTQDFWSVVDGIIPSPVYEKYAYMGTDGRMKIKIRQAPFDSDKWSGKARNGAAARRSFDEKLLKSFEISQSDTEVYTVFYAYLNGYPMDEQKTLVLSTMELKADETLKSSEEYDVYGYRPLIVHFLGYGVKDGTKDGSTQSKMKELSEKLKEWYKNLHKMFSGSMTFAMTCQNSALLMPGEVLCFLKQKEGTFWAEFYVEGITHSWNYGHGGDINVTVARGGKYKDGVFQKEETEKMEVGKLSVLMESMQK